MRLVILALHIGQQLLPLASKKSMQSLQVLAWWQGSVIIVVVRFLR